MRSLQVNEIKFVHGAGSGEDFRDFGTGLGLLFASMFAGAAAGHIGGSILGYQLASYAGAGAVGATLSGFTLGIVGAYAGAHVLVKVNNDFYKWAKHYND